MHDAGVTVTRALFSATPLLLGLLFPLLACREAPTPAVSAGRPTEPAATLPGGDTLKLILAVTPGEQERGLMFVESLPDDRGMLFLYAEDGIRPFWMKNCTISLDMIWLAADGTVVDITREAPPCVQEPCPTYRPSAPCRFTLEVRGGLAAERGLKAGDRILLRDLPPPGEGFARGSLE